MKAKFNICVAMGTRPEVIKLAPVVKALRELPGIRVILLVTGQHRGMMDEALKVFRLVPDHDLNVMRKGQTLFDVTSRILKAMPGVLAREPIDLMVVQGDTATTFACALSAYYHRIPVAHVEAGLRTQDKYRPFPEEMNRRLTGSLADIHFPPTPQARSSLLKEGVRSRDILMTGNTAIDALYMMVDLAKKFSVRRRSWGASSNKIILVTLHRRESFGKGLKDVLLALRDISMLPGVQVVYPVHMNPHVRSQVKEILSGGRVHLLEPLGYDEFVPLMQKAHLIVTDSGGIQEEACALKKPIIIARERTERPEAVEAGFAELLGFDRGRIVASVKRLLQDDVYYRRRCHHRNPFGDGKASLRIAFKCLQYLKQQKTRGVK